MTEPRRTTTDETQHVGDAISVDWNRLEAEAERDWAGRQP
jgi:hypothetical protein